MSLPRRKLPRQRCRLRVLRRLATRLTDVDSLMHAEYRECAVNRLHLHRWHPHKWYRLHPLRNRWSNVAGQTNNVAGMSNSVPNQPHQQRSKRRQPWHHHKWCRRRRQHNR